MRKEGKLYSLYGLRILSSAALPCPEHPDATSEADVHLREATREELAVRSQARPSHGESDGFQDYRRFDDGSAHFCWRGHFEFHVSGDGRQVLWRRLASVPDEVLLTYLLNQVLSNCLLARGVEPLHATSVVIDGRAIALMGDSGFGKSTLAAAFMRMGYPVLTDDVLVVEFARRGVLAFPSLPRLKLIPESAGEMLGNRPALPMNSFTRKLILPLSPSEHADSPVRLRTIFVLPSATGSAKIGIRRVTGRRAMLPLIRNTFNASLFSHCRLEQQFRFAGRLARRVPVKTLSYPRRRDLLPEVAGAVLTDLARTRSSA